MLPILLIIVFGITPMQGKNCVMVKEVYEDVKVLSGYNITSSILDVISRYESMNRMDCANQCMTLDNCLSIFYNSITNQCQFHTEVFFTNTGATTQVGTTYLYQVGKEAPTPSNCPTEDGFELLGSNVMCVKFHFDLKNWHDSQAACANYSTNGHLAVVDTAAKDNLVIDAGEMHSEFTAPVFIGLNSEGWVDGSPFVYSTMASSGLPTSNTCATYQRYKGWIWKPLDCNLQKHYVCQIPL